MIFLTGILAFLFGINIPTNADADNLKKFPVLTDKVHTNTYGSFSRSLPMLKGKVLYKNDLNTWADTEEDMPIENNSICICVDAEWGKI